MIPFDIAFLQPESVEQAVSAWQEETRAGRRPRWFSGGTELVTGARQRSEYDVLIDLKRIPYFCDIDEEAGTIGAGVRLSVLSDRVDYPLVANAARGVADRTVRNSITAGGNICGVLPYRELLLPVLLFDGELSLAGPNGISREPVANRFANRLVFDPGEFLFAIHLPAGPEVPVWYERRTRDARVDYPLVTLCMARFDGALRFAVGGTYGCPVRSKDAEQALAEQPGDPRARAEAAVKRITERIWDDFRASADYRRELLIQALERGITALEES